MVVRIKEMLKNQKGSSLAFVLIIGVVILLMVASLLTVANGDFTFTQETVESRQAYIDAKSVIEFGKIEMNNRMAELKQKNEALMHLYNDYKIESEKSSPDTVKLNSLQNDITDSKKVITDLETAFENDFYVYGDSQKVTDTLTKDDINPNDDVIVLGKGSVTKTAAYTYQLKLETQSLRRKLDYQVDFNYRPVMSSSVASGTPEQILGKPAVAWDNSFFHVTGNGVQLNSTGFGNVKKSGSTLNADFTSENANIDINKGFAWDGNTTLILKADNICVTDSMPVTGVAGAKFNITALGTPAMPATKKTPATAQMPGQIRFATNYNQINGDKNTLVADNIIFLGDLVIDQNSYLEIKCTNLWVAGNIIIRTNDPANATFINRITAENIIVGGTAPNNKAITVSNNSRVVWIYNKFYLNGQATTTYTNSGSSSGNSIVISPGMTETGQEKYY